MTWRKLQGMSLNMKNSMGSNIKQFTDRHPLVLNILLNFTVTFIGKHIILMPETGLQRHDTPKLGWEARRPARKPDPYRAAFSQPDKLKQSIGKDGNVPSKRSSSLNYKRKCTTAQRNVSWMLIRPKHETCRNIRTGMSKLSGETNTTYHATLKIWRNLGNAVWTRSRDMPRDRI